MLDDETGIAHIVVDGINLQGPNFDESIVKPGDRGSIQKPITMYPLRRLVCPLGGFHLVPHAVAG